MTITQLTSIINSGLKWNRVSNLPCVHAFYKDFYINLCKYNDNGIPTISLNVDDITNNKADIFQDEITPANAEFRILESTFQNALIHGKKILADSKLLLEQ